MGSARDASSTQDILQSGPIIGRSGSTRPTSADVHLYIDPQSCFTASPILYADCEGFEGGEAPPIASTATSSYHSDRTGEHSQETTAGGMLSNPFHGLARGTKRALKWANRNSPDYEKTSKRGFAISEMYPRIFYAFSDVVVYVLNNPK
jgi:hypothetical protein